MEKKSKRHVQLPNNMTENKKLSPKSLLIYVSIKRFMDGNTKIAFPSLKTISEKSGASINTVRSCIDDLADEKYLEIINKGKRSQKYRITDKSIGFEPFSYEFLDNTELSFTEKAYLLATQQYMFTDTIYGEGKLTYSNKTLSKLINMPESTISKCNKSLAKNEFLEITKLKTIDETTGRNAEEKYFHLERIGQAIIWVLKEHDDKINKIMDESSERDEKVESLERKIDLMQNQINSMIKDRNILVRQLEQNNKEKEDNKQKEDLEIEEILVD